jgi:chromate transporter
LNELKPDPENKIRLKTELKELAKLFLKLGSIGFGGPAAHLAMFEDEVVRKRRWMTHEHFLDLYGATNLIPGPNSTEMTIHIGKERAGWRGMIVAGMSFILPAVILSGILGWVYKKYGSLPVVRPWIYGIQPAIIAIILRAIYQLGRKAIKSAGLAILGIGALAACLEGINDILVMFIAGFLAILWAIQQYKPGDGAGNNSVSNRGSKRGPISGLNQDRNPGHHSGRGSYRINMFFLVIQAPAITLANLTGASLFWMFLKIGVVWFGGGYVLFGLLDNELVVRGLMSRQQLMDAIAVGQITPGPLFSSVTFIGWQLKGFAGALLATAGIFIPSLLFVGLLNPLIPGIRNSKIFSAFLDAVNVASIAIIIAVILVMGRETLTEWRTIVIAVLSLAVTIIFKRISIVFIVTGGALLGYLLSMI